MKMLSENTQSTTTEKTNEEKPTSNVEITGNTPAKTSSMHSGTDSLNAGKSTRMALTALDEQIRLAPSPLALKLQHLQIIYSSEIPLKQIDDTLLRYNGDAERAASYLFSVASGEEAKPDEKKGGMFAPPAFLKNLKTKNIPSFQPVKKPAKTDTEEESPAAENRQELSVWKSSAKKLWKVKSLLGMHGNAPSEENDKNKGTSISNEQTTNENSDASNQEKTDNENNFVRSPPAWKSEAAANNDNVITSDAKTEASTVSEADPIPST